MLEAPELIPGRYSAAIAVMQEMRWGWQELMAAPGDLVEEILYRRERIEHWRTERERLERSRRKAKESAQHGR